MKTLFFSALIISLILTDELNITCRQRLLGLDLHLFQMTSVFLFNFVLNLENFTVTHSVKYCLLGIF